MYIINRFKQLPLLFLIFLIMCLFSFKAYSADIDPFYEEEENYETFARYFLEEEYSVKSVTDENGNEVWYLVNNYDGTNIKISEMENMLSLVEEKGAANRLLEDKLRKTIILFTIITVILSLALIVFVIMWIHSRHLLKTKKATCEADNNNSLPKKLFDKKNMDVDDYSSSGAIKYNDEK